MIRPSEQPCPQHPFCIFFFLSFFLQKKNRKKEQSDYSCYCLDNIPSLCPTDQTLVCVRTEDVSVDIWRTLPYRTAPTVFLLFIPHVNRLQKRRGGGVKEGGAGTRTQFHLRTPLLQEEKKVLELKFKTAYKSRRGPTLTQPTWTGPQRIIIIIHSLFLQNSPTHVRPSGGRSFTLSSSDSDCSSGPRIFSGLLHHPVPGEEAGADRGGSLHTHTHTWSVVVSEPLI